MTNLEITDWGELPEESKRRVVEKCEALLTDIWAWLHLRRSVRTLDFLDPVEADFLRDTEHLSVYLRAAGINLHEDNARSVEEGLLNTKFNGSLFSEKLFTSNLDELIK